MQMIILSQRGESLDDHVRFEHRPGSDFHSIFYNTERSDRNVVAELGMWMYDRGGGNAHAFVRAPSGMLPSRYTDLGESSPSKLGEQIKSAAQEYYNTGKAHGHTTLCRYSIYVNAGRSRSWRRARSNRQPNRAREISRGGSREMRRLPHAAHGNRPVGSGALASGRHARLSAYGSRSGLGFQVSQHCRLAGVEGC